MRIFCNKSVLSDTHEFIFEKLAKKWSKIGILYGEWPIFKKGSGETLARLCKVIRTTHNLFEILKEDFLTSM